MSKKDSFAQYHGTDAQTGAPRDVGQGVSYPLLNDTPYASAPPLLLPSAATSVASVAGSCGRCSKHVLGYGEASAARVFVVLSCTHLMHASCFVDAVVEQKREKSCDEAFGGPTQCARCLETLPDGGVSDAVNSRDAVLKEFTRNFVNKYAADYSQAAANRELTIDEKRAILGIAPSMFSADKTDYEQFGRASSCLPSAELVRELLRRGRTLDTIFASTKMPINAQHLYRLGVASLDDLQTLGYDVLKHGAAAYRSKCPFWMLNELYRLDHSDLFRVHTGDTLMRLNLTPKEMWLCGVTMDHLVEHGLRKETFLAYGHRPPEILRFLDLKHAHFIRLGVRLDELDERWRAAARDDATPLARRLRAILENINK
jgi:hypothetical protein